MAKKKFLLKAGTHADDNGVFKAGDIVESASNLAERWPEKFATPQVSDPKTAGEAAETREALLAQLADLETRFPTTVPAVRPAARFQPVPNYDPKNPPAEAKDQDGKDINTPVPADADDGTLEQPEPADADEDLDGKTIAELKALAEEREVEVHGRTKADYIKALGGK